MHTRKSAASVFLALFVATINEGGFPEVELKIDVHAGTSNGVD